MHYLIEEPNIVLRTVLVSKPFYIVHQYKCETRTLCTIIIYIQYLYIDNIKKKGEFMTSFIKNVNKCKYCMVNLSMFYIPNRRNCELLLIDNNLPLYIFPKRDIEVNIIKVYVYR